jgi:hypothetical protein
VSIKAAQQGAHSEQIHTQSKYCRKSNDPTIVGLKLDAPYLQREISATADWSEGTVKPKD